MVVMYAKGYRRPALGLILLAITLILVIMLSSTPIMLLLKLMNPFSGVARAVSVQRIPEKAKFKALELKNDVKCSLIIYVITLI